MIQIKKRCRIKRDELILNLLEFDESIEMEFE